MARQTDNKRQQAQGGSACSSMPIPSTQTRRRITLPSAVGPSAVPSVIGRLGCATPTPSLLQVQLLCLLAFLASILPCAVAAPFSVLDSYAPACTLPTAKTINGELAGGQLGSKALTHRF